MGGYLLLYTAKVGIIFQIPTNEDKKIRYLDFIKIILHATIARYTTNKYIRNQTLFVQISSPALRTELGMMRKALLAKLNQKAGGTQIVTDIRFY